jgi:hypothetical protein
MAQGDRSQSLSFAFGTALPAPLRPLTALHSASQLDGNPTLPIWPLCDAHALTADLHTSAARIAAGGGSRSCRLAHGEAQARQEQFAVLRPAKRQIGEHDERGNGAQPCDDRARFVEIPHMGIAGREKAIWNGRARIVLNGLEQLRCRFPP